MSIKILPVLNTVRTYIFVRSAGTRMRVQSALRITMLKTPPLGRAMPRIIGTPARRLGAHIQALDMLDITSQAVNTPATPTSIGRSARIVAPNLREQITVTAMGMGPVIFAGKICRRIATLSHFRPLLAAV